MKNSADILNYLIQVYGYKSYLEIGVQNGYTHEAVNCDYKVGVDIEKRYSKLTHILSSNEFFQKNKESFDLIFVDGLHQYEQVLVDIENALKWLNDKGTIVVHDCLPPNELYQHRTPHPNATGWTGDVWKAWIHLRQESPTLSMYCVDFMPGHGIIQRGEQQLIPQVDVTNIGWDYYIQNTKDKMNIITVDEFKEIYK